VVYFSPRSVDDKQITVTVYLSLAEACEAILSATKYGLQPARCAVGMFEKKDNMYQITVQPQMVCTWRLFSVKMVAFLVISNRRDVRISGILEHRIAFL
jgi:hypothetical protein